MILMRKTPSLMTHLPWYPNTLYIYSSFLLLEITLWILVTTDSWECLSYEAYLCIHAITCVWISMVFIFYLVVHVSPWMLVKCVAWGILSFEQGTSRYHARKCGWGAPYITMWRIHGHLEMLPWLTITYANLTQLLQGGTNPYLLGHPHS